MENARTENSADGAPDLLLINLRTIGTHHCDQTVGEEAAQEIERLRAEVREAREFRDKLVKAIGNEQLRAFIEKYGEPVPLTNRVQAAEARADKLQAEVAEWKRVAAAQAELHGEAEARAERMAEALRKLEEREQRDEALLRQALEVLSRARQAAMVQTLKARIPECAEFGGIAQDLDFVVAALRERLGEGAEP